MSADNEALVAMILEEIDSRPDDISQQICFATVLRALQEHPRYKAPKPQLAKVVPMTHAEAMAFQRSIVPCWKYQGCRVIDVPIGYFESVADPNDWLKEVRRYLASSFVHGEEGG